MTSTPLPRPYLLWCLGCLAIAIGPLWLSGTVLSPAVAVETQWIMYHDPVLPQAVMQPNYPPGLPELWSKALELPARDLKRRAAAAVTLGNQSGVPGLEATAEPLMKLLQQPDLEPTIRLTAVQALVQLEAQQAADLLFQQLRDGNLDMAELVEPALARWKYAPMRQPWLARLEQPIEVRRWHILAVRGLAELNESAAQPRLLQLSQDRNTPVNVRVEAAIALGKIQSSGLENVARSLLADKSPTAFLDRLVAVRLLAHHRGAEAEQLLTEIAADPQPSIQACALESLFQINPDLILPLLDVAIASHDANVRRWAAETLIARATPDRTVSLLALLNDPDPGLRRHVCHGCVELAKDPALHEAIVSHSRDLLAGNDWRGQEQATLLLVSLDDKSIANRLLELLEVERPEVHTTAAWGLSRLEVPETLAPILEIFERKCASWGSGQRSISQTNVQLSHLAQAMGQMNYMPADQALRKLVPKTAPFDTNTRGAAIWALGRLYADNPEETLADMLIARVLDINSMIPEDPHVGAMAAVALGRMKAAPTLPGLQNVGFGRGLQSEVGYACAWAISQITGQPLPDLPPIMVNEIIWFLIPVIDAQQ